MSNVSGNSGAGGNSGFGENADIERELVAVMNDFVESVPAPAYDPAALMAARGRRRTQLWALAAAVVAVAAIGTGVAVLSGGGGQRTAPPAATHSRSTGPSASPTPSDKEPLGTDAAQAIIVRSVVTAAELYENPATRGQVDLAGVAAQFTDQAAFARAWGHGGLGVTCGAVADGAFGLPGNSTQYYRGAQKLARGATPVFDASGLKLTGLTCAPTGYAADPVVPDVYGGLISGSKSGDGMLGPDVPSPTCGRNGIKSWYAEDQASGTVVEGWTVRVDGGKPFAVTIDPNTRQLTEINCHPSQTR